MNIRKMSMVIQTVHTTASDSQMIIVTSIARVETSTVTTLQSAITHFNSSPLARQCHHSDLIELHCPSKGGFEFLSGVRGYTAVHK
jgi:hypothetical protein